MKKVKNYIEAGLAKKKLARYKYWSLKDENGITICSSEDNNPDNQAFADVLDKIISDNVDAEVSVKYGTNEQSSRQNPPFFIKVNEEIEWIEPETEETVNINGVPHRVDKQGNVNINLTTPTVEEPKIETAPIDTFRQEMEIQLNGLRREHELKEEKWQVEMQNKLLEQTLKFKEMMLSERESRIVEKEQVLAEQEAILEEREREIKEDVKGYVRQLPNALGGVIKDWMKDNGRRNSTNLSGTEKKRPKRSEAVFSVMEEMEDVKTDLDAGQNGPEHIEDKVAIEPTENDDEDL